MKLSNCFVDRLDNGTKLTEGFSLVNTGLPCSLRNIIALFLAVSFVLGCPDSHFKSMQF